MNRILESFAWLRYKNSHILQVFHRVILQMWYAFMPKKKQKLVELTPKKKLSYKLAGRKLREDSAYNPFYKWPPNLNCFCGSAIKFKKCHQDSILPYCTKKEAAVLEPDFKKSLAQIQKLKENNQSFRLRNPIL